MTARAKLTAYAFIGILVGSLVIAMAPSASAQTTNPMRVTVTHQADSSNLLDPEVETLQVPITVKVEVAPASGCSQTVILEYQVAGPTYATPVLTPQSEAFRVQGAEQTPLVSGSGVTVTKTTTLYVSVTRLAPAFLQEAYVVTATARGATGSCNLGDGSGSANVPIKYNYFPLIEVQPVRPLAKSGQNSEVIFTVDVTNRGNGQTQISSEFTYLSQRKLDALIPPTSFILDSQAQQGSQARINKQVPVTARTPNNNGYTNNVYTFQVKFTGAYAAGGGASELTSVQTVTLSLQVQGVYVPGFDPTLLIGAVGLALVGIRRFGH